VPVLVGLVYVALWTRRYVTDTRQEPYRERHRRARPAGGLRLRPQRRPIRHCPPTHRALCAWPRHGPTPTASSGCRPRAAPAATSRSTLAAAEIANATDTDGDGLSDGVEVKGNVGSCKGGTNPLKADTDGDSLSDGAEVKGWTLTQKVRTNKNRKGKAIGHVSTNRSVADTDGDGLRDAAELKGYKLKTKVYTKKNGKIVKVFKIGKFVTNPVKADTDGDGLSDSTELKGSKTKRYGTRKSNPVDYDTDRGGASDGHEISKGADPTRTWSGPNRP